MFEAGINLVGGQWQELALARSFFREVAEKAGIHVNYYARSERGEVTPRVDIVESVAKELKIRLKLPLD